ncbi:MAG TPA: hypothetical protein VH116_08440, partial [Gemmatimonadales bacterium]|nr:hypothetical protein [Gemmatimonadales bacterium]
TGDVTNPNFLGHFLSPEFINLKNEAASNGALVNPVTLVIGGNQIQAGSVDLSSCATWSNPVNCVMLQRTEARFGDGTHPLLFTTADQLRAFTADYNLFDGVQTMYGQPRHIRIGAELNF